MHPLFRKAIPEDKRCPRCPICGAPVGTCDCTLADRAEQPSGEVEYVGQEPTKEEIEQAIRNEFNRPR